MPRPVLRVQLLGGFHCAYNSVPVPGVHSARLQSLLGYLILHRDTPQLRQYLAFQLWPDTTEVQARNNLRQFIYQLRQALPEPDRFLKTDAATLCWKTDEGQEIDVVCFEASLNAAKAAQQRADTPSIRHNLEQSLAHYRGDLLPGCYDDWIIPERLQLREQYQGACQKLIPLLETQREYAAALQVAQRLQRLEPLEEDSYVSLLRLYSLIGDRAGAQRMYQTAVETLRRELNIEPGEALQRAYDRLKVTPRVSGFFKEDASATSYRLVGRQEEWQQLQTTWDRATKGNAHLCLITGEAGIGKSRMAEELYQWVLRQGFTTAYTRSYGMEGRLTLGPISEWLRSEALHPHLASLNPVWLTEIARLLPEILSQHPDIPRPEVISGYSMRQPFFEALAQGILIAPQPLLLWIDDLHWCDQETLEWLHFLLRFAPRASLLLLGTARSEETPLEHPLTAFVRQLHADGRVTVIELLPLDAAETAKLASQVQSHALDDVTSDRLYRETEGNPLFIVETVRVGLPPSLPTPSEASLQTRSGNELSLPPRVQATIAGRLAQLSPAARSLAEIGAVFGRGFGLDLLQMVGLESEESLINALNELWTRRIVRERSANVFDFTHDRLRDVAYAEINAPQRRLLHRRIAQALESLHAEALDAISGQVAAHYEQAGLVAKAVPYYQRAGAVAASVYANEDAIHLFTRGVKLLEQLPVSTERDMQELNIQLELATLYCISKGWASPEEEQVLNRTMVLSDRVGTLDQRLRGLFGLQSLYVVQAQFDKVEQTYARAKRLFDQTQGQPPAFAQIYLVGAQLHCGRIAESRDRFEQIVAARDDKHILGLQEPQGLNYRVHGLAWNSHALWCLGYPQAALTSAQAAIAQAREYTQPFNHALAITYLAMLQTWQTDPIALHACVDEACTLTREYKAPYYYAWATILRNYVRAERQPDTDHLASLRHAIHAFIDTGARIRLPVFFTLLAQVCLKAARWEEAREALEQAQAESIRNNERWWDAEIHRLRGDLMWGQGVKSEAVEAAFIQAVEIARSQQARSLELRSVTRLAQWWQVQARPMMARQRLLQTLDGFTEGFDTPDLLAAQALLARL